MTFTELLERLTTRCYDPEIRYDHESDQWIITLVNWTSESSKDSPVGYCKEANQIGTTLREISRPILSKY